MTAASTPGPDLGLLAGRTPRYGAGVASLADARLGVHGVRDPALRAKDPPRRMSASRAVRGDCLPGFT
jgi:hypothetical protein